MELTVRDASAIFNIPESTVFRWIKEKNLPSREINGDYRFSRAELLEWATVNRVKLAADIFQEAGGNGRHLLFQSLTDGGIAYRAGGADKETVLRDIVAGLPLPEGQDRESLLYLFLSREAMGATALGNGIAIPHPRHPIILPLGRPFLHLCFLERPIDFGAADTQGAHTLFVLICPTIRVHLQMLARIARLLRDDLFQAILKQKSPAEKILDQVRRVEEQLE
jgi:nitrogen PTS system EIIA component